VVRSRIVFIFHRKYQVFLHKGCILGLFALLFITHALLWAGTSGSISGIIKDPSGEVISGAAVTVKNMETGLQRSTTSNSHGFYAFPSLPIGNYQIQIVSEGGCMDLGRPMGKNMRKSMGKSMGQTMKTCSAMAGFQSYEKTGIVLDENSALRVDAVLTVGSQTKTVKVTDSAMHVDTQSTQMGDVITGKMLVGVPLNGRSFTDRLALQPGVAPQNSAQPGAVSISGGSALSPSGDLNPGNLSVSGQQETNNGFMVNGSDVEEDVNMGAAVVPNLDSIREFRILTNNFNAEYGNYSGGQILVVTKSGTNQLHGDAFEFLRNTDLDARNYFEPVRGTYQQNQFGGTVGGPIRKNKAFFFADYQGTQMTHGVDSGLIEVPSMQDRSGNLSDITSFLTGNVTGPYWASQLSQKLGYTVKEEEPYYTQGCTSTAQCVFPNAVIPQRIWSVPAKRLLQYIPEPNDGPAQFTTADYAETLHDNKEAGRIDANTRWGQLDLYYFLDDYTLNNPYPTAQGGANVPGFSAMSSGKAQLVNIRDVKVLGANTINEAHFSYMRDYNNVGQPVGGVGPSLSSQGFVTGKNTPGIVVLDPSIEGVENTVFNNYTIGVSATSVTQANNTYQGIDSISHVVGAHSFQLGGEFHLDQINMNPQANFNGSFSFQGSQTGLDFADFLLGIASSYSQGSPQNYYPRNKYIGVYGQDSWRVRHDLTLNYGLRWDLLPPWREKYNQMQTIILGQESVVFPGAPRGMAFPGDPGVPNTLAPTQYHNFSPRVGLAYSPSASEGFLRKLLGPTDYTSVRAGYGIFYTAFPGLAPGIMGGNPPYGISYTTPASPLFSTPFILAANGQDLGQRFPYPVVPYGASPSHPVHVNWAQDLPISGDPFFDHNNVDAYAENYMLSIERQLNGSTVLSVSYVGTQAHHLLVLVEDNPGNPALCLSLSQPSDVAPSSPTCGPFNESLTFTTPTGKVIQGTRGPLGGKFSSNSNLTTANNSEYNGLEMSLQHDVGNQQFLLGYTYSKSIDQSSSLAEELNPSNYSLTRAVSAFDVTQNFVASYDYALPLNHLLRRHNVWTTGWEISGVTHFSTGFPVTLFNNNDTSLLGTIPNGINNNGVDTPEVAPGPLKLNFNPRNGRPAFNYPLFGLPPLGQNGNTRRRYFYGPGAENFDVALMKNLLFAGARSMQLRLETFNLLNHGQFFGAAAVNGNISSDEFGQFVNADPPRIMQLAVKFAF